MLSAISLVIEQQKNEFDRIAKSAFSPSTGLYNATKTLAFASNFYKMRVKILY